MDVYKYPFLLLFFIFSGFVPARSLDSLRYKNSFGVDFNYAEFLGYSIKYKNKNLDLPAVYMLPFVNIQFRYFRDMHRYLDIAVNAGVTSSYFSKDVYLKVNTLPLFTPLKKKCKTLQIGTGFSTIYFIHDNRPYFGVCNQLNYLKKSIRKKFQWGFNLYGNVYFLRTTKERLFTIGTGFFFGGYF
ncbi:MAG TPA: hypothetical protein PKO18_03440 [Chitinophagales bacterium]|nr:hypothetical protein [Chitinophagales bacterium]